MGHIKSLFTCQFVLTFPFIFLYSCGNRSRFFLFLSLLSGLLPGFIAFWSRYFTAFLKSFFAIAGANGSGQGADGVRGQGTQGHRPSQLGMAKYMRASPRLRPRVCLDCACACMCCKRKPSHMWLRWLALHLRSAFC